jgi:hypothetical protein
MYVSIAADATPGITNGKCNEKASMDGGRSNDSTVEKLVELPHNDLDRHDVSVLTSVEVRSRQSWGLLGKEEHMICKIDDEKNSEPLQLHRCRAVDRSFSKL